MKSDSPNAVRITLVNRQRDRPVDRPRILRLVADVLAERGQTADVVIHWVSRKRSAELNQQFLQHEGPTDIITFDYGSTTDRLQGELFICIAEAVRQAAEFRTDWKQELHRYVIHGLLHLRGFDDREPAVRRVMKREENRLVRRFG
ncbi:MAG: rRNA maturation RNase YbeY [Verrucomicrobia bacterium]|nr:rRNA maturation RNase YbeY [Verrucomicrobiota bacterium]